jgi:hypothetical protein
MIPPWLAYRLVEKYKAVFLRKSVVLSEAKDLLFMIVPRPARFFVATLLRMTKECCGFLTQKMLDACVRLKFNGEIVVLARVGLITHGCT